MDALLVIDVQHRFYWTSEEIERVQERKRVADNIARELRQARLSSRPIIFIVYGHTFTDAYLHQLAGDCGACNTRINLAKFVEHRHHEGNFEPIFFKTHDNAFTNPNLAAHLKAMGIEGVTLLGCNTYACVLATACGALDARFNVTLLADCVFNPILTQDAAERWVKLANVNKPPAGNQCLRVANI